MIQVKIIDCFDLKTLYTNIPHDDLVNKIFDLIHKTFELKEKDFVNVSSNLNNISWSKCKNPRYVYSYNREDVKNLLRYLIDNIFVKFRGRIYKQNIGVPMGCDCAPFLANLYLFCYEYQYIKDLVNANHWSAAYFKYCRRFIEDLCIPNGVNDFVKIAKDILCVI